MLKSTQRFVLCTTFLFATTNVLAQDAENESTTHRGVLEEVLVTARKREESLMAIPVSVSTISDVQIENGVATDLLKLGELAPQVLIGRATNGTGGFLTIRGISSSATDAGLEQSVALSFDGVPIARGRIVTANIFDVDQVEVMQGPQALFFGKNSPAGVISVRTADPTDTREGYLKGGYEFEADERYLEGAATLPVSDTFSARIAARFSWIEGWIKNVAQPVANPLDPSVTLPGATFGDRGPEGHNYSARVTLAWTPSDTFDANFKLTYDTQELNAMDAYLELFCVGDKVQPTQLGIPMPGADCEKNQVKAESSQAPEYSDNYNYGNGGVPYYDSDFILGSLNLNWTLGDLTLSSTTGYYDQSIAGGTSADYSPFTLIYDTQQEDYRLFTQELRLFSNFDGPVNFMVGAYYEDSARDWGNFPDIFHFYNAAADSYVLVETVSREDTSSYSFFGQLEWNLTEALTLSAGARYTSDDKKGRYENLSFAAPLYPWRPVGDPLLAHYDDDNVSPEVTLTWNFADEQMIYAGYKTGYKAGAISNGALLFDTFTPESVLVDPEETDGFEVGYKGLVANGRLRLDVTAYDYDYDGLQVAAFDEETFSFVIGNAAAASTRGIAANVDWAVTDRLSLNAGLGYNRARYEDYRDAQCYTAQTPEEGCVDNVQDLTGKALNRAPDLMFNLGADYAMVFDGGWMLDLSGGAFYTDDYQAATDYNPAGVQESFWRFNTALHLTTPSNRLRFSLIGRNITDEYYQISVTSHPTGTPDQFIGIFNRPREVLLQAEWLF